MSGEYAVKYNVQGRSWLIAGTYAVLSTVWILHSDALLSSLVGDTETLIHYSVWKGLAFVGVTALLLLLMVRRLFGALAEGYLAVREAETRYRMTLDSILEGCQIISPDWTYLYLNKAACRHNRRPGEELLGKRMTDMWPGLENAPFFKMLQRCRERGLPEHEEMEFQFTDGSCSWFDMRVQPVPEGLIVFSIDITERRNAEQRLRELNEGLEQKIAERTVQLREALLQAESADRLKSAFLATMSHELRTPLNSIIGFTGILLQELPGPLNEEQRKQLGMVRGSGRHLLELINDVLDLSKIEAGQLEVKKEPYDLRETIERVVAGLRPQADKKGLFLEASVPSGIGRVHGDRRRVEQVLINLLGNGLKFTEKGGVSLRASLLPPGGQDACPVLRLAVADSGIGIMEEDLEDLFKPFRQMDAGKARLNEGTGLGLAICKRLVGLMGGRISVDSKWGQGSEFIVLLPADARVAGSLSSDKEEDEASGPDQNEP